MEKDWNEAQYLVEGKRLHEETVNNAFTFDWGDRFAELPGSIFKSLDGEYHCHAYDVWEVLWYNYIISIFYFIGLNYTHLGKIPVPHLSLTAEKIKKWGCLQYSFISIVFVWVVTLIVSVFTMYYYAEILLLYSLVLIGFILFLIIAALIF